MMQERVHAMSTLMLFVSAAVLHHACAIRRIEISEALQLQRKPKLSKEGFCGGANFSTHGYLTVNIGNANNLPMMPGSMGFKTDVPDAYVKFRVQHRAYAHAESFAQTPRIKNQKDPTWNYTCAFPLPAEGAHGVMIDAYLYDKNGYYMFVAPRKDGFIGEAHESVTFGDNRQFELQLRNKGKDVLGERGRASTLTISVEWHSGMLATGMSGATGGYWDSMTIFWILMVPAFVFLSCGFIAAALYFLSSYGDLEHEHPKDMQPPPQQQARIQPSSARDLQQAQEPYVNLMQQAPPQEPCCRLPLHGQDPSDQLPPSWQRDLPMQPPGM